MARQKIFITKQTEKRLISDEYWYSYLEENGKNIFRVYKQQELIHTQEATVGDAFELIVKGPNSDFVLVTPMTAPRKDWEAVAWLLGFSKHERFSNYKEYLVALEKKRETCEKPGYVESVLEGPNFEFCEYCIIGDTDSYHNLVCWIDPDITKKEIVHLIPEYEYPEAYLRKMLKQRFGVSDVEFDGALLEIVT